MFSEFMKIALRCTLSFLVMVGFTSSLAAQVPSGMPKEGLHSWYASDGLELADNRVLAWKNSAPGTNAAKSRLNRVVGQPLAWVVSSDGGSRRVVRLDGNAGIWSAVGDWGTADRDRTIFVAVRTAAKTSGYVFDGSTGAGMSRLYANGGHWHVGNQPPPIGNAGKPSPQTHAISDSQWEVQAISIRRLESGLEITHVTAAGIKKVKTDNVAPQGGLILGCNVDTRQGLKGDLGEFGFYTRAFDDKELQASFEVLQQRWTGVKDSAEQLAGAVPDTSHEDPRIKRVIVRREGDDGSKSYRIPGMTVTPKGTIVTCFDIRWNGSGDLPGNIDVGVMRSTDNGDTWGPMIVALDYDQHIPSSSGNGVGDPAILVDRNTGHLFIAALWSFGNNAWNGSKQGLDPTETGQLVIARSTDDGLTWEAPRSITTQIKQKEWRLLFNGPGAGIQLTDGTLVFPAQFKDAKAKPSSCFIYSKDQGENWHISPAAIPGTPLTSESQIVQLGDGSLLMTMRNETRDPQRAWSRWQWAGDLAKGTWVDTRVDVTDPVCMAGLTRHPSGVVLLSNNNSNRRERMTIRYSKDEGQTWSAGKLLDPRPSAYSCLATLANGDVGVLYECGDRGSVETLTFARFPLEWVTEEKPKTGAALESQSPTYVSTPSQAEPTASPGNRELSTAELPSVSGAGTKDLEAIKKLLDDKAQPVTWVFTGDSITHGALHTKGARSYPEHFAERVRWELRRMRDVVINTGISGDTAQGILADFPHRVGRFQPQVVSVMIGMNDCSKMDLSAEQFQGHLEQLVAKIREGKAIPVLATTNTIRRDDRRGRLAEFNDAVRRVCASHDVVLIDNWGHWSEQAKSTDAWLNDAIHPNGLGHAAMANRWFDVFGIYDSKSPTCQLGAGE